MLAPPLPIIPPAFCIGKETTIRITRDKYTSMLASVTQLSTLTDTPPTEFVIMWHSILAHNGTFWNVCEVRTKRTFNNWKLIKQNLHQFQENSFANFVSAACKILLLHSIFMIPNFVLLGTLSTRLIKINNQFNPSAKFTKTRHKKLLFCV